MKSRLDTAIELLHSASEAALATASVSLPGYPFATLVPFALDAQHRPLLLLSGLAEHSRNLAADPRASLLVAKPLGESEIARVTLLGSIQPVTPESALVERYLRYQPAAERFLQLGDFAFRRFELQRLYIVGGFAQAGWLEQPRLLNLPAIEPEEESTLIASLQASLPAELRLLGIDAWGCDLMSRTGRIRISFSAGPVSLATLPAELIKQLQQLGGDS